MSSWVMSSFGISSTPEEGSPSKKAKLCKRKFRDLLQNEVADKLLVEKYTPPSISKLAVHKKKVEEVESWLWRCITNETNSKFLLLTGPAGSGKTATIISLAHNMDLNVQEWINPVQNVYDQDDFSSYLKDYNDYIPRPSQAQSFSDFFLSCFKYTDICSNTRLKNLILIEDFPNAFLRNPFEFFDILRHFKNAKCSCPVVFIISDSPGIESAVRKLFPQNFVVELDISIINFNPIAMSLLTKALQDIVALEKDGHVSKELIVNVAEGSGGDIRCAINSLQFILTKGITAPSKSTLSKPKKVKRSKGQSSETSFKAVNIPLGGKDPSLVLFHALGKVLYCKRDTQLNTENQLPIFLKEHERLPLLEIPEEIFDKAYISAGLFNLFLHENFTTFCSSIEDAANILNYLAVTDVIASDWSERGALDMYVSSIGIRGTMHYCGGSSKNKSWKPFVKPAWINVNQVMTTKSKLLASSFQFPYLNSEDVTIDMVPFFAKIKGSVGSSLIQTIGAFESSKFVSLSQGVIEDRHHLLPVNSDNLILQEDDLEEDFCIEEYDD